MVNLLIQVWQLVLINELSFGINYSLNKRRTRFSEIRFRELFTSLCQWFNKMTEANLIFEELTEENALFLRTKDLKSSAFGTKFFVELWLKRFDVC